MRTRDVRFNRKFKKEFLQLLYYERGKNDTYAKPLNDATLAKLLSNIGRGTGSVNSFYEDASSWNDLHGTAPQAGENSNLFNLADRQTPPRLKK